MNQTTTIIYLYTYQVKHRKVLRGPVKKRETTLSRKKCIQQFPWKR